MAEYAILLTLVVAAIIAMQVYVKRGMQAKMKAAADNVGWGFTKVMPTNTKQYEPYYQASDITTGQDQKIQEKFNIGGTVDRESHSEEVTRTGSTTTGVTLNEDDSWK